MTMANISFIIMQKLLYLIESFQLYAVGTVINPTYTNKVKESPNISQLVNDKLGLELESVSFYKPS